MGLTPGYLPFTVVLGATFRTPLQFYEGPTLGPTPTTVSGLTPLNLTGFTGAIYIRIKPHEDPPMYTMTTENGGIILSDPTLGTLELYMPAADTIGFTWRGAVYDFFLTDTLGNYLVAGDTVEILKGRFNAIGSSP